MRSINPVARASVLAPGHGVSITGLGAIIHCNEQVARVTRAPPPQDSDIALCLLTDRGRGREHYHNPRTAPRACRARAVHCGGTRRPAERWITGCNPPR